MPWLALAVKVEEVATPPALVVATHWYVCGLLVQLPPEAKLIPGHGPLSTAKELNEFHEMLVETSGIVRKAISAGKTLEQIKTDGLPPKWKSWEAPTQSTSRWLEILYQGLTRK